MKLKIVAILLGFACSSLAGFAEPQTKYILKVDGLACPSCSSALERRLKKVKGVESVEIDLEKDEAVVLAREGKEVEEDDLREVVKNAGFTLLSLRKAETDGPPQFSLLQRGGGAAGHFLDRAALLSSENFSRDGRF